MKKKKGTPKEEEMAATIKMAVNHLRFFDRIIRMDFLKGASIERKGAVSLFFSRIQRAATMIESGRNMVTKNIFWGGQKLASHPPKKPVIKAPALREPQAIDW